MMRMTAIACAAAGLVALGGCMTSVPAGPVTGSWGGKHVGLELDRSGGRLEYDCAAGTIDEPLIPARDGSFAVSGTHTPGTGGPDRVGYVPPSFPARYSGTVGRARMMLRVVIPSRDLTIGPYDLRRDAEPGLFRCL